MSVCIAVLCQPDAHKQALAYADIVSNAGLTPLVNFPSEQRYLELQPKQKLLQEHVGAVIILISPELFRNRSISEEMRSYLTELHSVTVGAFKTNIIPIVVDDVAEQLVAKNWIGRLSWKKDTGATRAELSSLLSRTDFLSKTIEKYGSFAGIGELVAALARNATISAPEKIRVPKDNIAFDIYRLQDDVFADQESYFVYLLRGIAIAKTAFLLKSEYAHLFHGETTRFLLNRERGQTQFHERLENFKSALGTDKLAYVEDILHKMVTNALAASASTEKTALDRTFLEPEVRPSLYRDTGLAGQSFTVVMDWLEGGQAGVLVLEGQGGIGKTWALLELERRIVGDKVDFEVVLPRTTILITSLDVLAPGSPLFKLERKITLYDLYVSSVVVGNEGLHESKPIEKGTFYAALETGSLIILVDGLDEVVARFRVNFDPHFFFDDLQDSLVGESNGKVVISCRKVFFDLDDFQYTYPNVSTYELLPFDKTRRDSFFKKELTGLQRKQERAVLLSDEIAKVEDAFYVPFVLDCIVNILRQEADGEIKVGAEEFSSDFLIQSQYYDRVLGEFCERERYKISNPSLTMSVDQQVRVLWEVALFHERDNGLLDSKAFEGIVQRVLGKKSDVRPLVDTLLSHPFIMVEKAAGRSVVDLRFDFMPEYLLAMRAMHRINSGGEVDSLDIKVFSKYFFPGSTYASAFLCRIPEDEFEFLSVTLSMLGVARSLDVSESEGTDGTWAQFCSTLIALLGIHAARHGEVDHSQFNHFIRELFVSGDVVDGMAVLDGGLGPDKQMRFDFRDLEFRNCIFNAIDFWSCQTSENTRFVDCRFSDISGQRPKLMTITPDTFSAGCVLDDEFQKQLFEGAQRVENDNQKVKDAIISFVSDFYKSGRFAHYSPDRVEAHYKKSSERITFKKIFRVMLKEEVFETKKDPFGNDNVYVVADARADIERLITQGQIRGKLVAVRDDLLG